MQLRWKTFFLTMLSIFFPILALADDSSSMSFAPPPSDISVTFLGNIFGMVDGVLHSTGSQIMGIMFGVFNAAVLSLGGIVMMYIILVSTMNTAHEGQMLGQKWSSIWVPTRAVIGLALLIPKASGYCLMQIFVMWVVLQGVGVADKIWGASLDYMNRGGVIIQADMDPSVSMNAAGSEVITGSARILYGQVCMLGLQTQLETLRSGYLAAKDKGAGNCSGTLSTMMKAFCDYEVNDFLNSVSPITTYNDASDTATSYTVKMPNFKSDSIYYGLNGVCGTISWKALNQEDMQAIDSVKTLSSSDIDTIKASRAAAVEQVYMTLSTTARTIISNDPQINSAASTDSEESVVAEDQFGVPLQSSGDTICSGMSDDCPNWGAYPDSTTSVLLSGTELQEAVEDYNAVMGPTVNLIQEAKHSDDVNKERKFISKAEQRGWIMAGSYFFDLAELNGSAASSTNTDSDTGLSSSTFNTSDMRNAFGQNDCQGTYATLCELFGYDNPDPVIQVANLIDGTGIPNAPSGPPDFTQMNNTGIFKVVDSPGASTVFGYAYNEAFLDLPGQAGADKKINVMIPIDYTPPKMGSAPKMSCSKINLGFTKFTDPFCQGMNALIAALWTVVASWLVAAIEYAIQVVLNVMLVQPLQGFIEIFQNGVDILDKTGVNPISALAKMGATYIDFSMDTFITAAIATAIGSFYPTVLALMTMTLPLFFAWLGLMVGIGFLTAYYIPFLPYMIFTFGTIAWMISVIEAMVAAPIVALGIAHPEGHDALGKSEQGMMILLNVFLRPGMMIIGYIAGIALSFVGVWIMNAGFQNVLDYLVSDKMWGAKDTTSISDVPWASYFGEFFGALMYVMMYLTIVEKAFTLIAVLPDKVLRWIGGQPEGVGQETMQWTEGTKGKIGDGGKATNEGGEKMMKQATGHLGKAMLGGKSSPGGNKTSMGKEE
jgi:defect-in-organelle-trafficking protein DotA